MTYYEQVIQKLLQENELKEYDTINLENSGFYLKGKLNIVKHNEMPTLLTHCNVAVVVR